MKMNLGNKEESQNVLVGVILPMCFRQIKNVLTN
jgi:hypothetical protein